MSSDSEFRVKLEFRKVLKAVSEGLSSDNLSSLKHLCYDYISERAREEIETGRQLFDVLIEKGTSEVFIVSSVMEVDLHTSQRVTQHLLLMNGVVGIYR